MPNTNAPFGLLPLNGVGAAHNFELVEMYVSQADSTAIYTGDPVKRLSTGFISRWTAGTAVSQLAGIFMGCEYLSQSQGRRINNNYWPGNDVASGQLVRARILPLNLAAPVLLRAQTDATGAAFADIGINVDVNMGTGNPLNGRSGAYIDMSTAATTATLPFRIIDLWGAGGRNNPTPGNNGSQAGAYNWVIVAANTSGAGSTGV